MEAVFCNELVLEEIFKFLPTPDLLLKINRVAAKWNLLATKLVEKKRKLYLNNDNILAYVDMLNARGSVHKNIKLELSYLEITKLNGEEKIIQSLAKFAENVKELSLPHSLYRHHNADLDYDVLKRMEGNFRHQILLHSKNVESLSIIIGESAYDRINGSELLKLSKLLPLQALKFLDIGEFKVQGEKLVRLILEFLHLAPNLEVIHFGYMPRYYQIFEDVEAQFPGFIQKIGTLNITHFCQETSRYLLSRNFSSLKYFRLLEISDVADYVKVLEKYADQLVIIHLGVRYMKSEKLSDTINLPVMKNLECLGIIIECGQETLKNSTFSFWNCSGTNNLFPKLVKLKLDVCMKLDPLKTNNQQSVATIEMINNILYTALPDMSAHPIFPSFKNIAIVEYAKGLEFTGKWIKPELFSRLKKYFPNVDCSKWLHNLEDIEYISPPGILKNGTHSRLTITLSTKISID